MKEESETILPIVFPALYNTSHWNQMILTLTANALKTTKDMNEELFESLVNSNSSNK